MKLTGYLRCLAVVAALCALPFRMAAENDKDRKFTFAWGAGLCSNIDLSQHSMSTLGINAEVGMRWKWIRFIGFGAEGDFMVSNSSRAYPLYIDFRTDFKNSNQLLFLDLKGGLTLNYLYDSHSTNGYASGGVGINLARGKTFASHIILAYTYLGQDKCYIGNYERKCPGISMATLRLGITFQ